MKAEMISGKVVMQVTADVSFWLTAGRRSRFIVFRRLKTTSSECKLDAGGVGVCWISRVWGSRDGDKGEDTAVGFLRPREPGAPPVICSVVSAAVTTHCGLFLGSGAVSEMMRTGSLDTLGYGPAPALSVTPSLGTPPVSLSVSMTPVCILLTQYRSSGGLRTPGTLACPYRSFFGT